MEDLISRQAAIDALRKMQTYKMYAGDDMLLINQAGAMTELMLLPSAQPEIIHCGECTKMKVDSVFHDCWCSETGKKVWINHYCGYAERREVTT